MSSGGTVRTVGGWAGMGDRAQLEHVGENKPVLCVVVEVTRSGDRTVAPAPLCGGLGCS